MEVVSGRFVVVGMSVVGLSVVGSVVGSVVVAEPSGGPHKPSYSLEQNVPFGQAEHVGPTVEIYVMNELKISISYYSSLI